MKAATSLLIISCIMSSVACTDKNRNDHDLTGRLQKLHEAEIRINEMDTIARYKAESDDLDTLMRDAKAAVSRHDGQGLCAQGDWAIQLPQLDGEEEGFLSKAQDLYNTFAAYNAIYSDYDIWARGYGGGDMLVDSASVVKSMKSLNADCIKDDGMREAISQYKNGIVWSITHPQELTEQKCPNVFCGDFWKYMSDHYLDRKGSEGYIDTSAYYKLVSLDVDSIATAHFVNSWNGDSLWWKELIENENFDNRVKLSLQSVHRQDWGRWELEVMMALMQSGRYSPLLPRLWRTWRCCCQTYYCGMSRDSYIPNYLYNRYRKMVYTTIINQLIEHPDDKQAFACALYILVQNDMIRNGSYIYGNECAIEELNMGLIKI